MGGLEQLTLHSHYFTTPNLSTHFFVLALSEHQDSLRFIKLHSRIFQSALGSTPSLQRGSSLTQGCALPVSCLWGAACPWGAVGGWGHRMSSWAQSTQLGHKVSPTKTPGCICTAGTGVTWMFPSRNSSIKPNTFKTRAHYNPLSRKSRCWVIFRATSIYSLP